MKKLIEFKEQADRRDILRALLDNRTLKTSQGYSVFYDCLEDEPFRINEGDADEVYIYHDHSITHEEIEVEWYDDIPEHGVLCWVWGDDESLKVPAFIYSYNPQYLLRFKCCPDTLVVRDLDGYLFKNAAPMTVNEVKNYIFAEQLTNELSGDR